MSDTRPSPPAASPPSGGGTPRRAGLFRRIGTGIITGAADDDPSAIGTYASAGARFGFGFLWIAPVLLPMMYAVVYLSAKLGQVYGKGLFAIVRDRCPAGLLYPLMLLAVAGNVIEAAANLGGVGAAIALLVPVPVPLLVAMVAALVFGLQLFGSYALLRTIFQWLCLALFAYVAAAFLARPDWGAVARATLVPQVRLSGDFLMMVVACIGTSLSAYVYTWQSNQEVEEQIERGRVRLWQRKGATDRDLRRVRREVLTGMLFSNMILYFIILATGATLHREGVSAIDSAAQAAQALEPLAGSAAKWLFAAGVVGVGLLAVPVMTTGAAYDLVQGIGREGSLTARPGEAKLFYATIGAVTSVAVLLNLLGFNPMRALVWSGVVQGFSVPPLLAVMLWLGNDRRVMGARTNGWLTNLLAGAATLAATAATGGLVASWLLGR